MGERLTLYLSNFASHRTPGMWGPAYAPLTDAMMKDLRATPTQTEDETK